MTVKVPSLRSPAELISLLNDVAGERLDSARGKVAERSDYMLGSGEAEEVALLAGVKPMIRQTLEPGTLARQRSRFEALGFSVAVCEVAGLGRSTLLVGDNAESVRAAGGYERHAVQHRQYGELLGYPRCCRDAFADTPDPRRNAVLKRNAYGRTQGQPAPRLNVMDLAIFHYLAWLPCSFSCEPSRAYADGLAEIISTRYAELTESKNSPRGPDTQDRVKRFLEMMDSALSAHRLLLFDDVQISVKGDFRDGVLEVHRFWPSACDRPRHATLQAEAAEATARLLCALASCRTIAVSDGTLVLDGIARFRTEDALLVPFGVPDILRQK